MGYFGIDLLGMPCQHLAGVSVVDKTITALTDAAENINVIIDLLGFDGWTSLFGLSELSKGNRWAVGTVCHYAHETSFVAEITSNRIFSLAREGALKVAGFPNFKSVIEDLQRSSTASCSPEYSICTPLADGTLVIKQALIDLWTVKNEGFKDEAAPSLKLSYFKKITCSPLNPTH